LNEDFVDSMFLYIDPLKQGLKHAFVNISQAIAQMFLYIDPLKQGLKPRQKNFPTSFKRI